MVLWSPDTCKCVLKLNNDDLSLNQIIKTCPAHTAIPVTDVLATVLDENHLKNDTMTVLRDTIPEITTRDEKGNILLKRDEVSFEFEGKAPNRTIRVITKTDISEHVAEIQDQIPDAVVDVKSKTKRKK